MDSVEKHFKDKRRWQIALRRYVIEKKPSPAYAPYFGIDIDRFRQWIELQFSINEDWSTFGKNWQLDQVVPAHNFILDVEEDLRLCWHFINIRVERLPIAGSTIDLFKARKYFEALQISSNLPIIAGMLTKINIIQQTQAIRADHLAQFLEKNSEYLTFMSARDSYAYLQINTGVDVEALKAEVDMLSRFGG